MAKKYIIYANGNDLATIPVTQNEGGKYYWNGSVYYKPVLGEFDTAILPAGFKAYLGGSHSVYLSNAQRNPIDFSLIAGTIITMNVDVQVLASTLADGSWCKVQIVGTNIVLAFVHTYKWASGIVKAGGSICVVAPQSVTGFAPHLHNDDWSGLGRRVRDLILNGDYKDMATFKIGDKIIFTEKQNKRGGAGTGFQDMGAYEVGDIATIKDNPRSSQNAQFYGKGSSNKTNDSYTWYDTISSTGQSFWVADIGKFRLATSEEVNPPKPQEPTTPSELIECQNRAKGLESEIVAKNKQISTLTKNLEVSEAEVKGLNKLVKRLEGETEELNNEKIKLQEDFDRIKKERDTFEREKLDLQEQLSKGSLGDASASEMFAELWRRFIKSLDRKA